MRAIVRAFQYFRYYLAGCIFFVASFALNALCFVCLALPFRRTLSRLLRSLLFHFFRAWVMVLSSLRVSCLRAPEPQDPSVGGCVWVMNHPSVLDGAYILTFVRNGTCIYKEQIASNPFYGCIARLANYIPNVGGPDMIRFAVEALKRGENIVIFPEGTRSARFRPDRMKSGFALMAKRANAPIKLLWSDNPPDYATKEASKWHPPELPVDIPIRLIDELIPSKQESAEQLAQRVSGIYQRIAREKDAS